MSHHPYKHGKHDYRFQEGPMSRYDKFCRYLAIKAVPYDDEGNDTCSPDWFNVEDARYRKRVFQVHHWFWKCIAAILVLFIIGEAICLHYAKVI